MTTLKYFIAVWIFGVIAFGYIFLFKHLPIVGIDYVLNNIWFYILVVITGTLLVGLFYVLCLICEEHN